MLSVSCKAQDQGKHLLDSIKGLYLGDSVYVRNIPFYYESSYNRAGISKDTVHKKWKCTNVIFTADKVEYGVQLELSQRGTVIYVEPSRIIKEDTANRIIAKYGIKNFHKILEGRVDTGMSKEEVILTFGKPESVYCNSEGCSWSYGFDEDGYFFDNKGILIRINKDRDLAHPLEVNDYKE